LVSPGQGETGELNHRINALHGVTSQKKILFNRRIVGRVVFDVARVVSRKVSD
jgi:hypothetical protein